MELRLIVVRTADMNKLVSFYECLKLSFEYHRHGNSPFHYSANIGKAVLEIYPLAKDQQAADKDIRLGFAVDDLDAVMKRLRDNNVLFVTEPVQTAFGFMTVITDPDGRKIELYKK